MDNETNSHLFQRKKEELLKMNKDYGKCPHPMEDREIIIYQHDDAYPFETSIVEHCDLCGEDLSIKPMDDGEVDRRIKFKWKGYNISAYFDKFDEALMIFYQSRTVWGYNMSREIIEYFEKLSKQKVIHFAKHIMNLHKDTLLEILKTERNV